MYIDRLFRANNLEFMKIVKIIFMLLFFMNCSTNTDETKPKAILTYLTTCTGYSLTSCQTACYTSCSAPAADSISADKVNCVNTCQNSCTTNCNYLTLYTTLTRKP